MSVVFLLSCLLERQYSGLGPGEAMASLGSDLVFGFQQVLFDLIILFFEGLGLLDHFLGFLDQVGGTVWVTEPKAL